MDLRPSNIMIPDSSKRLLDFKLIDFGLMETRPFHFHQGKQVVEYQAFELFIGYDYNEAVDIWSLGVSVLEVLLMRRVFGINSEPNGPRHASQVVSFWVLMQKSIQIAPITILVLDKFDLVF